MNRQAFIGLLLAVLLAAGTPCLASGKNLVMGNLMSVNPDRAFDAARNPALLGMPGGDSVFGLFVRAGSFIQEDISITGGDLQGNFSYDSEYTGSVTTGYAWRSGSLSYGIAFYNNTDDEQIRRSESTISASFLTYLPDPGMDVYINYRMKDITMEYNPTFNFAVSVSLGGGGHLGTQLITGFTRKTVEQSVSTALFDTAFNPLGASAQEFTRTFSRFTIEAGLGYIQHLEQGHTGIMFRTGTLMFESIEGDLETENTFSGLSRSGMNVSNSPRYSTGPMIIAGFYKNIISSLGCAFEMGYRFPVSYSCSDLEITDDFVTEKSMICHIEERYEFKGGVEYNPSSAIAVTAGILYSFGGENLSKTGSRENYKQTEYQDFSFWAVTGGIHYRLNETTRVTAGAALIRGSIEIERLIDGKILRLDMVAGASMDI